MDKKTLSRSRQTDPDESLQTRWHHIEQLIDDGGDITLGAISRNICAISASDEEQCLAMLQHRDRETFVEMLNRLDAAIAHACVNEEFIDEINPS